MKKIDSILAENNYDIVPQEKVEEMVMGIALAIMVQDGYLTEADLGITDAIGPYLVEQETAQDASQEQSKTAEEAKRLGLESMGFGKWGKNGEVTHVTKDGKLTPVAAKPETKPTGDSSKAPDILSKLGLKIHKDSPGLIDYAKMFTQGAGKVITSAFKGDKEAVKQQLKSVSREDVIDFLYKLDLLTLHAVTGPLHMIDAITGWDIKANIKDKLTKGKTAYASIKAAIINLKEKIKKSITPPKQAQLMGPLQGLEAALGSIESNNQEPQAA